MRLSPCCVSVPTLSFFLALPHEILVSPPEIKPGPPAVEDRSPDHWTSKEAPLSLLDRLFCLVFKIKRKKLCRRCNFYFTERLSNLPETLQLKGGLQKISLSELLNRVNTVEEILPNMKMKIEEETLKKKICQDTASITCESTVYSILGLKNFYPRKDCVTSSAVSDFGTPVDWNPPGSSVHGILQARILERVAIPFSRGSSQPKDQSPVSCIAGRFLPSEPPIWISSDLSEPEFSYL